MIYKIKKYGSEILREKCENVKIIDENILEILQNMKETMMNAEGLGLAAPQVGFNYKMFVFRYENEIIKVINPEIQVLTDEKISFEEGCLSIPGIYKTVFRPSKIRLRYIDIDNTKKEMILEELPAIIAQHEYDHLDGILFIDKISPMAKRLITNKLKYIKKNQRVDNYE